MTDRTTRSASTLSDTDIADIAAKFEKRKFTPDEVETIKRSRRRSPRIGDSNAEVVTFRAPPQYKNRIKQRAPPGSSKSFIDQSSISPAYLA